MTELGKNIGLSGQCFPVRSLTRPNGLEDGVGRCLYTVYSKLSIFNMVFFFLRRGICYMLFILPKQSNTLVVYLLNWSNEQFYRVLLFSIVAPCPFG